MKKMSGILIFCGMFIVVMVNTLCAHAQSLPFNEMPYAAEKNGGSVEMILGQTSNPIYVRGAGRGQRWAANLLVYQSDQAKRVQWSIKTSIMGGSIIDNADRFSFELTARVRLHKNFFATFRHNDNSNLNNTIVADVRSRRLNSSVNGWWGGVEWQKRTATTNTTIGYSHMVVGNEPLFETGFTQPYARNLWYAYRGQQFKQWGIRVNTTAQWYTNNQLLGRGKCALGLEIEKTVPKNEQWSIVAKGFKIINTGIPRHQGEQIYKRYDGGNLYNPQGVQVGFRYRF